MEGPHGIYNQEFNGGRVYIRVLSFVEPAKQVNQLYTKCCTVMLVKHQFIPEGTRIIFSRCLHDSTHGLLNR